MTKKEILITVIIIILILLVILFINKNKMKKKIEENLTQNSVKTMYNEDKEKYVVYDEKGKEIYNGTDKVEAEFRERHPDFNPGFENLNQNMIPTEIIEN